MTGALIDSNVLIDILTRDPHWFAWSRDALAEAQVSGAIFINPVIYAELGPMYPEQSELDAALAMLDIQRLDLTWRVSFQAGRAFAEYRERGGPRTTPLPDLFIGAHAYTAGMTIVTRDTRRFRTYFPSVPLVTPAPSNGDA